MGAILTAILGVLTGKAGEQIGGTVAKAAELASLAAIIGPALAWIFANKNAELITITVGDAAFWFSILGLVVFIVVRLVHRAPPPA